MSDNACIEGGYFARGSSLRNEARLLIEGNSFRIVNQQGSALACYAPGQFRISDPVGDLPYRFEFEDGATFETTKRAEVERSFRHNNRQFRWWVHGLEQSWRWVLLALLLLPILTWGFLQYGLPIVAEPLARQVPQVLLEQLDNQVMEELDDNGWVKPSRAPDSQNQRLQSAWSRLGDAGIAVGGLNLQQRDGVFFGANAFALPGGTIVVTDQLLAVLESEQQLVAVLAHEIGHVELRHGTRNIVQALGIAAIFAAIVGDVSWLAESILVTAPTLLQQMSYSRNFEREADNFAIDWLQSMTIPASCLGASLNNIVQSHQHRKNKVDQKSSDPEPEEAGNGQRGESDEQDSRWFDYLSTHPATQERIALAGGSSC